MASKPGEALLNKKELAQYPTSCRERVRQTLDNFFHFSARGSTLIGECRAGTTAFLATANNFIVNAQIMSHAGLSKHDIVVSSAFVSGVANIISGLLSNQPVGLMTSVGPNVFLAYSLVGEGEFDIDGALAVSLACGALLFIFSLTPVLQILLGLIPLSVKYGLVMGTGLLTAFIGLKSVKIVVADIAGNNIVALGKLTGNTEVMISAVLLVLMASMIHRAVRGAVLIGMLAGTLAYWVVTSEWPTSYVQLSQPHLHTLDLNVLLSSRAWPQVLALLLMLLFSISGAVIGCGRMAGLLKEDGGVAGSTAVYLTCGLATMLSAKLGSSPVFVSMSAAAGIRDGGRTGIVSIVIGVLSILTALFFSPLASTMPHCATAPVLLLVGFGMLGEAKEVRWWNTQEALPAFLCAIFQPFTYSVSNGIYAGVGMSFILFITTGSFLAYLPQSVQNKLGMATPEKLPKVPTDIPILQVRSLHDMRKVPTGEPTISLGQSGSWHVFGNVASGSSEAELWKLASDAMASMGMGSTEADTPEPEPKHPTSEPCIRSALMKLAPRRTAVQVLEKGAKILGVNEELSRDFGYRLTSGGARNIESHWAGGMPGVKSQAAMQSLLRSMDEAGSQEQLYAAELMAREAPMVVAKSMRDTHAHLANLRNKSTPY